MGNINKQEFKEFITLHDDILKKISDLIGYKGDLSETAICHRLEKKWNIDQDYLYILDGDDEEDFYSYKISSYAAKEERFFIGNSDGLYYVLAYNDEGFPEDSEIFILNKELQDNKIGW